MDFIVDNYLWFIIGGIVILMISIGYIAEQTSFGRKPFLKKEKQEKDNGVQNELSVDEGEDFTIFPEDATLNDLIADNTLEEVKPANEVVFESEISFDDNESNEEISTGTGLEDVNESIEEPMPVLNDSELVEEKVESEEMGSVEDVVVDDLEDDVWKF